MPTIQQAIRNLEQLKRQVPTLTGNEMVNFALDNIRKESWQGKRWQRRKPGTRRDTGRGLLVDTGEGRRSIQASSQGTKVNLTANKYMQAHNDGVNQRVNVRAHSRRRKGRTEQVKSFTRQMNLPQRQFTGESAEQTARINKLIQQRIIKALT